MTCWIDRFTKPGEVGVSHPWTGVTNEDLLAQWDGGQQIWTCRMADLGPIHEQWIHAIGMEMLRAMLTERFDFKSFSGANDKSKVALWQDYSKRILDVPLVRQQVAHAQPEEMQVAAAMNLAGMFARNGYESEMNKVPESRRILMSRAAPQNAS